MPPKVKCYTRKTTTENPPRTYVTCNNNVKKGTKPKTLEEQAKERTAKDGIPRIVKDGKILKKKPEPKPAPKPAPKSARNFLSTLKADRSKIKPSSLTKNRNLMTAKDFEIEKLMKRDEEILRIEKLSSAEKNKLDPAKLFGILPQELRKKILDPKETGVKVAQGLQSMEKDAEKLDAKLDELRKKHWKFSGSYGDEIEAMANKLFKEKTRKELVKMYKEDYFGGVSGISTSRLARKVALFATPFPKRIDELNTNIRKIQGQLSNLNERISAIKKKK